MVVVFNALFAAALPSLAPVVVVLGDIKSSPFASTQVPVARDVADVLY